MMLPAEEFLCGSSAPSAQPIGAPRWLRPAAQWLAIALVHIAVAWGLVQVSPQARQTLGAVIQAGLIAPQALPTAKPPEPSEPPPRAPKTPSPAKPVLVAAPRAEAAPAAFLVAEPHAEPATAAPAAPAVAAPPPLVPPVFNAAYLENPPPQYPSMSRRLGEKGRVLLRVFVSAAGHAGQIEIKTSSGFERLDSAAREAVAGWRFVPARRGDEEVAAWVLVPVSFVM